MSRTPRLRRWWAAPAVVVLAFVLAGSTVSAQQEDDLPVGGSFFINLEGFADSLGDPSGESLGVGIFDLGERGSAVPALEQRSVEHRICYFSLGTREAFRSEADFPPALWDESGDADTETARPVPGVEAEYWVRLSETNRSVLRDVVAARATACEKSRGTGILVDWPDSYLYGALTGFDPPLSEDDALLLARDVAQWAKGRGLAVGLRNMHQLADQLVDEYDFVVADQCLTFQECDAYSAYAAAGKPIIDLEYRSSAEKDKLWSGATKESLCKDAGRSENSGVTVLFVPLGFKGPSESCGGAPSMGSAGQ